MAVFADPVGAVFGLWQPKEHIGAQLANEPGTYCWSELITTDLDASKAFYGAVFGWGAEEQGPPGGPPAYTEWKVAGKSVGGMMQKSPDMPAEMPPLGCLLRRGRHRCHGGEGPGARCHLVHGAHRHRAWALRCPGRQRRRRVQRPAAQGIAQPEAMDAAGLDGPVTRAAWPCSGGAACWAATRRGSRRVAAARPSTAG